MRSTPRPAEVHEMRQPSLVIARGDTPAAPSALLDELVRLSEDLHADYLEHYGVCPLGRSDDEILLATWREAVDPQVLDDLALLFEAPPRLIDVPERDVRTAIRRVYGSVPLTAEQLLADLPEAEASARPVDLAVDDLLSMANEAPVVRLVNMLLVEALDIGASDVHLEAYADNLRARYRVDGVLQDAPSLPKHLLRFAFRRLNSRNRTAAAVEYARHLWAAGESVGRRIRGSS